MVQTSLQTEKGKQKFRKVLREFERGQLLSRGRRVTSKEQAIAIAFSEARRSDSLSRSMRGNRNAIK